MKLRNKGSLVQRMDRMETLLNNHLQHHQEAFDRLTKIYIPLLLGSLGLWAKFH